MIGIDILIACFFGGVFYISAFAAVRSRGGSRKELIRAFIFISCIILGAIFLVISDQYPHAQGIFRALAILIIVLGSFAVLFLSIINLESKK